MDSESGVVVDATTLHKPRGWQNNPTGRLRKLAMFHANYTPVRCPVSRIAACARTCWPVHA